MPPRSNDIRPALPPKVTSFTILLLPESSILTLASILDPLRAANRLSRAPLFNWSIQSLGGQSVPLTCGVSIDVDGAFDGAHSADVLIVIAGFSHDRHVSKGNIRALANAKSRFGIIAAVEAGTWVLAQAGLITHHSVTTHWEDTDNLSEQYPNLDVRGDRYVIDGNIWSCGGASPAMDMMLHFIRQVQNKSLALDVASVFIYSESASRTQSQPSISLGRIKDIEPRLARAVSLMEDTIEEPMRMGEIARRAGLPPRRLEILSGKYLGAPPAAYYRRLRLQAARKLVLDTNLSVQEISVRTGFKSQAAFSRAFRARYKQSARGLRAAQ